MLKRVSVDQLAVGMYVARVDGRWLDHPFWRPRFKLKTRQDVQNLQASAVGAVWIDNAKGLDVADQACAASSTAAGHAQRADATTVAECDELLALGDMPAPIAAVDISEELQRAQAICQRTRQAVTSMLNEARMGRAIDSHLASDLVGQIAESVTRNAGALISMARLKTSDTYTYMHSVAVCALMIGLARSLGLPAQDVRRAGLAGLLHDVGKIDIPGNILRKPGQLSDEEFALVRKHPEIGHQILLRNPDIDGAAANVSLQHHERIDGMGYPKGLKGEEISLFAKMGAICDVYDAITSHRPYKCAWDPAESIRIMAEESGKQFDPVIFEAFVKTVGVYPIGSLIRLKSNHLAVVVDQGSKSLLSPKVKVFYCATRHVRVPAQHVDLSADGCADAIAGREDPADWPFSDLTALWTR